MFVVYLLLLHHFKLDIRVLRGEVYRMSWSSPSLSARKPPQPAHMQTDLPARSFTQYTLMTQRPALIHKHKHTHSETNASAHPRKLCSPLADVVDKKIKTLPIEYACVIQRLAEMGLPDSQGPSVWSSSPLCGHVPVGEHVKQQLLVFLVCALAEAYWCSDAENVRISPRFVISRVYSKLMGWKIYEGRTLFISVCWYLYFKGDPACCFPSLYFVLGLFCVTHSSQ